MTWSRLPSMWFAPECNQLIHVILPSFLSTKNAIPELTREQIPL